MIFFVILYNVSFMQRTKSQYVGDQHRFRILRIALQTVSMFQILHDFDIWNMKSATFLYAGMNHEYGSYVRKMWESASSAAQRS